MPYDVTIKTTNGDVQEQINNLKEMEALLIKYYDTYISMSASEIKTKKKTLDKKQELI